MTHEDYKEKLAALETNLYNSKVELMKEFVRENNPFKKGDIVTDHIGSIRVDKMGYAWGYSGEPPCATYTGVELKKDGTPSKKGTNRTVYQSNIIKV